MAGRKVAISNCARALNDNEIYIIQIFDNAPSGLLGPMSGIFLLVGLYCVSASQLGAPLTAATVNPFYIAGSLCVPVSWGLHVAAWIQKKTDM